MANLLSLDLTSALRVAVEQSMPRSRGSALLNSVQAADRAVSKPGSNSSTSNKDTEAHRDRVEIGGNDVTTLVTGGMFETDAAQANTRLQYTSEAKTVSPKQPTARRKFTIIA